MAVPPGVPVTRPEASGFTETSRYDDVIGRRDELPSGSNLLRDPPPGEPAPVVDLAFRPLLPAASPVAPR